MKEDRKDSLYEEISRIPLFDTHMHCTSLSSVQAPGIEGFATDFVPSCGAGKTTLITLLCSPYMTGQYLATGAAGNDRASSRGAVCAAALLSAYD